MKELYEIPDIHVIVFGNEDIITTSVGDDGIELPDLPVSNP